MCLEMTNLLLGLSMFCTARCSYLFFFMQKGIDNASKCSFVFAFLTATNIVRNLANIQHRMGIKSSQRRHPIRITRSFQSYGWFFFFGLVTEYVEHISFLWIGDQRLRPGISFESMRQLSDPVCSSLIFENCFTWYSFALGSRF